MTSSHQPKDLAQHPQASASDQSPGTPPISGCGSSASQPTSFAPSSGRSSRNSNNMAHCTLSAPSTAAQPPHLITSSPRSLYTVNRRIAHTASFISPSSKARPSHYRRLCFKSEPGREMDWPPPADDDFIYC